MKHVSRTQPLRQARLLWVLAVLLGLLAMHGLASTHHAAAAPAHRAAVSGTATSQAQAEHEHEHGQAAVSTPEAHAAMPAPACHDECPSTVAVLCLAVVTGVVAAAALARQRVQRLLRTTGPQPPSRQPGAARSALPGPDPVVELCVSRT